NDVPLVDGVFSITLELNPADLQQIILDRDQPAYIQVKDLTNDKTYPRQKYLATPYALKVPVDGETIGYDNDGRLSLMATPEAGDSLVTTLNAATAQTLSSTL